MFTLQIYLKKLLVFSWFTLLFQVLLGTYASWSHPKDLPDQILEKVVSFTHQDQADVEKKINHIYDDGLTFQGRFGTYTIRIQKDTLIQEHFIAMPNTSKEMAVFEYHFSPKDFANDLIREKSFRRLFRAEAFFNPFFHLKIKKPTFYQKKARDYFSEVLEQKLKLDHIHFPKDISREEKAKILAQAKRSGLLVFGTGLGKTFTARLLLEDFLKKLSSQEPNKKPRILIVAHTEGLLNQIKEEFSKITLLENPELWGRFTSTEKDLYFSDQEVKQVILTTNLSIKSLKKAIKGMNPDFFDFILVDEAHHSGAKTYQAFLKFFHPSFLLGLSATPFRQDEKNFLNFFGHHFLGTFSAIHGIEEGFLPPIQFNLANTATQQNPTLADKIKELVDKTYLNQAQKEEHLSTILFAKNKEEALKIKDLVHQELQTRNIPYPENHIALLTGKTTIQDRETMFKNFKDGTIWYLINIRVLQEGADLPNADMIALFNETGSLTVFLQSLGRGTRSASGKFFTNIMDFQGGKNLEHYQDFIANEIQNRITKELEKDPNSFMQQLTLMGFQFQGSLGQSILKHLQKAKTYQTIKPISPELYNPKKGVRNKVGFLRAIKDRPHWILALNIKNAKQRFPEIIQDSHQDMSALLYQLTPNDHSGYFHIPFAGIMKDGTMVFSKEVLNLLLIGEKSFSSLKEKKPSILTWIRFSQEQAPLWKFLCEKMRKKETLRFDDFSLENLKLFLSTMNDLLKNENYKYIHTYLDKIFQIWKSKLFSYLSEIKTIDLETFEKIKAVKKWILENHPDLYMEFKELLKTKKSPYYAYLSSENERAEDPSLQKEYENLKEQIQSLKEKKEKEKTTQPIRKTHSIEAWKKALKKLKKDHPDLFDKIIDRLKDLGNAIGKKSGTFHKAFNGASIKKEDFYSATNQKQKLIAPLARILKALDDPSKKADPGLSDISSKDLIPDTNPQALKDAGIKDQGTSDADFKDKIKEAQEKTKLLKEIKKAFKGKRTHSEISERIKTFFQQAQSVGASLDPLPKIDFSSSLILKEDCIKFLSALIKQSFVYKNKESETFLFSPQDFLPQKLNGTSKNAFEKKTNVAFPCQDVF